MRQTAASGGIDVSLSLSVLHRMLTRALDVSLRQAPRALGEMGREGVIPPANAAAAAAVAEARETGDQARATISFQAGMTTLGPVALGPAPKVYEVR